jgi:tetratricopeptide (TPR) repeat protein
MSTRSRPFVTTACAAVLLLACSKDKAKPSSDPATAPTVTEAKPKEPAAAGLITVTTKSEEARALYAKATKLQLELRATDAHAVFEQAVAKDPELALAHLGLANTAQNNNGFFAGLDRALALSGAVSEVEQQIIRGAELGAKGDPDGQKAAYTRVVELAPKDPQALNLLGNHLFNRQDYAAAIEIYNKAIALDPGFTAAYNQLGYAYRFTAKFDDAERTFKKYIELLPNDPNPYDSYAELLMKIGKFDESIASYEKALAIDKNFVASYIGIGNNHIFAGRGDQAREAFAKLTAAARNPGEQRQALFWTAVSYTHEGKWDEAIKAIDDEQAIAVKNNDLGQQAGDHNVRANILLESGKPDAAAKEFQAQLDAIDKASVPDEVKTQTRRNRIYDRARVALAKKDVKTATALLEEYGTQVAAHKVPFEQRQHHELAGMIAIETKRFPDAIAALTKANQQDPRVLYLLGVAHAGAGDKAKAKELYQQAHDFNGLAGNLGFVRGKAKKALAGL